MRSQADQGLIATTELDIVALQVALLASERGSFRRAAELLGVEPSAVSRKVRALEDNLGVSLLQRQNRGVEPTPAGRKLLARARTILDDLTSFKQAARRSGVGADGVLTVGVVSSIAGGGLGRLFSTFLATHPGVEIGIVDGSPRHHIPAVAALRMDATFVVGRPPAPGCEVENLWSERIMVAFAADSSLVDLPRPIDWPDIADARFIVSKMDPGPEIQDFVIKHLATLGRSPDVEPRPVSRETLLSLIGLGFGISLVGEAEAAVQYPGVRFAPLADETLPFHVIWSTRNDNPVLRRFLTTARAQVKADRR